MFMLFALSVVTAGLGVYYRDSCTTPYGCLGNSGLLLYVECGKTLCSVNHTAVDLRMCQNEQGPPNGSDTWLDPGCTLLGGGCTRRFVKADGSRPWCVPVVIDKNGSYAPAARVGTTKCRIECNQDYGVLDANGSVSCACPTTSQAAVEEACKSTYTEIEGRPMTSCFCQSPSPCTASRCPCTPSQGAMARTMDLKRGSVDIRVAFPFAGLFPVLPCKTDPGENRCPTHWQQKRLGGYGALALAQGYRFLRPSFHLFYQPMNLSVSAWRENSCVCSQHCLSNSPTILCILPVWSRRPVRCVPLTYLEKTLDLRNRVLPVEWQNEMRVTLTAAHGVKWTCSLDSHDRCEVAVQRPLDSASKCACLSPCTPSICPCSSGGFRLFEHFDEGTMEDGLCTLSGTAARDAWNVTACKKGPTPCAANQRVRYLKNMERKVFALGYRYLIAQKWLRPLPVTRPLQQGECICIDRCNLSGPIFQCRLTSDPDVTLSRCHSTASFPFGDSKGIVLANEVPKLTCKSSSESKTILTQCSDITCNDESCNTK